jgi:hypothetical protein
MADDLPWFSPGHTRSATAQPRQRAFVWTLTKRGRRVEAELLDHGVHGVEVQFFHQGVLSYARRWPSRALALAEADDERKRLMAAGWQEPPAD